MAFSLSIDTSKARPALIALKALDADIRAEIVEAVTQTAAELRQLAVQAILGGAKTGRIYVRGMRRFRGSKKNRVRGGVALAFHRASAPGEAPASDTGNLARRLRARIYGKDLAAIVTTGRAAFYGLSLEYGRRHTRRGTVPTQLGATRKRKRKLAKRTTGAVQPRPFLDPAAVSLEDVFLQRVADGLEKQIARFEAGS